MRAQVMEKHGNLLSVRMVRQEACGNCHACFAGRQKEEMTLEAENRCGAQVGDWVELTLAEHAFFSAVVLVYLIPLVAFMAGLFLGYSAAPLVGLPRDITALVAAVVTMAVTYFYLKKTSNGEQEKKYRPIAVKIVPDGTCEHQQK